MPAAMPAGLHPYHAFLNEAMPRAATREVWTPQDRALPALYVSHGAPPLFEDTPWMWELFEWAQTMPTPRGILIVSAHWENAPLSISSAAAGTPLVYDFGGFDPMYYQMTYSTPDASSLKALVTSALSPRHNLHEHTSRGLDHGAWVPLKVMYPHADVPVVQLSLPTHDPSALLALGAELRVLRDEGILVVGSGFMTHGLPFLRREHFAGLADPAGWSRDFDAWAAELLAAGDVEGLADFRSAPGMPYAHPTVEHFTPLFLTLGASGAADAPVTTAIEGYAMGLSKRSFSVV